MIKTYRKKPIEVEAIQWTDNHREVMHFVHVPCEMHPADGYFTIQTLEGEMRGGYGDYIIKGVAGEFYPCKKAIFEQTYEEAT